MKTLLKRIGVAALALSASVAMYGQDALRGHWSGAVEVPNHSLGMDVDLDKQNGAWVGSISIPEQNATGIPLDTFSFENGKFTFRIKGGPGNPQFTGALSEDGKTMSGDFTQGPGSFPFKFTRSGDAKVTPEKISPPVAKEFLGTWEGTLEVGQSLRLVLKLSNGDKGASATLVSVDQGGVEIPVAAVEQKAAKLKLTVTAVGGSFDGDLSKDGSELSGTWTQGGNDLPLKLKKAGAAVKQP